jgi:hypothetical protein
LILYGAVLSGEDLHQLLHKKVLFLLRFTFLRERVLFLNKCGIGLIANLIEQLKDLYLLLRLSSVMVVFIQHLLIIHHTKRQLIIPSRIRF